MKKHIWQNENWLEIPEIDKEDEKLLSDINQLNEKISQYKDHIFFKDVIKDVFVKELFYNWHIEGIILSHSVMEEELIEKIFNGNYESKTGHIYKFMQSRDAVTIKMIIDLHDEIIKRSASGLRIEHVGVGLSEEKLVYLAPPPEKVKDLLEKLCNMLNDSTVPRHYLAAFAHVAFVLIHPFQDGNGRMARILEAKIINNYNFIDKSRYIYMSGRHYYKKLSDISVSLKEFIKYILYIYINSYDNLYRICYNIDLYLKIHKEKYTSLENIQHKIIFDSKYENEYYITD